MPLALFNTPLDQLTADHVRQLLNVAPESQFLDFKQRPRRGRNDADGWTDWASEAERKELAKDVVAFANADGGWLVLGIQAQREAPSVAETITPIPEPSVLAERLLASIAALISPHLQGLQARGIVTMEEGGVIIIRVPSSPDAPHAVNRNESSFSAHVRRNAEARPMTMLEIQAMTIESARRAEKIEEYLESRSEAFSDFDIGDQARPAALYRISVLPARAIFRTTHLYSDRPLLAFRANWTFQNENEVEFPINSIVARYNGNFRPKLRGVSMAEAGAHISYKVDIEENGAIEFWKAIGDIPPTLNLGWMIADALNAITIADRLRVKAGFPDSDLMLTGEIFWKRYQDRPTATGLLPRNPRIPVAPQLRFDGPVRFPFYRFGAMTELSDFAVQFANDIYNAGGLEDLATGLSLGA